MADDTLPRPRTRGARSEIMQFLQQWSSELLSEREVETGDAGAGAAPADRSLGKRCIVSG